MQELLQTLIEAIRAGRALAYCRLVETRGSTPQKSGALMLVHANGQQCGTLGGGCVEAEVKRRAVASLISGVPTVHTFHLDNDYGWDDGLICGGRMRVLVCPVHEAWATRYFSRLAEAVAAGQGVTEVIAYESASAETPVPQMVLFADDQRLLATLPDPTTWNLDPVREHLVPLSHRPRPYVVEGMAYLPVLPRCRLLIVGGGHVGKAVADLAYDLDFDVWVVDDRDEFVSEDRFPRARRRISGVVRDLLPQVEVTPDTYCLIVTRGHNHDEQALEQLVQRGARYVGMIGSRRKIRMIFEDLQGLGVPMSALQAVHAPVGIPIGSQTVAEIAISICAELVAHRNGAGIIPGSPANISGATPE